MRGAIGALLLLGIVGSARADLHFPAPMVTFGETRSGQPLNHRFDFINPGPGIVEIVDIRTTCGCLKPQLSKRAFQPGEGGSLFLEVNTLTQPAGPHGWRATVVYRQEEKTQETAVQINAIVIAEIAVEPPLLNVLVEKKLSHLIVVKDLRPKQFCVMKALSTNPHLHVTLQKPTCDPINHVVQVIQLELTEEYPEGQREEVVSIYTDDPAYPDLKVPVNITKHARQRLSAAPAQVELSAPAGQPLPSRIVLLHDADNQPVIVDRITSDDPAIICRWAQGPNNLATLKIEVDQARLRGGNLHSAVHVEVGQPVRQIVVIPVSCKVR